MLLRHGLLAVGLSLALTLAAPAAPAPNVRAGNSRRAIHGTIVRVHHSRSSRHSGWILVRRAHHHRGRRGINAAAAVGRIRSRRGGNLVRFAVNSSTRIERLGQRRNGAANVSRTSLHAIRTGERVRVIPGSRSHHAAREVDILTHRSQRSTNRHSFGNGRSFAHRRSALIGSRVLARHGRPQYYRTAHRNLRRTVVRRPIRHTLVQGRVAQRTRHHHHGGQALTAAMKKDINRLVKHDVKKDLHKVHKQPAKAHHTSTRHAASRPAKHTHSSGHAKPAAHRKR